MSIGYVALTPSITSAGRGFEPHPSHVVVFTLLRGDHQVWPVTHRLIRTLASSRETPMPSARLIDVPIPGAQRVPSGSLSASVSWQWNRTVSVPRLSL